MKHRFLLLSVGSALLSVTAVLASNDLPLNSESLSYDSHPSMSIAGDGTTWVAWHSYANSRDEIKTRWIAPEGSLSPIAVISGGRAVHGPPNIVPDVGKSVWIVWSSLVGQTWQVVVREYRNGKWHPEVTVSDPTVDAVSPSATRSTNNDLVVVWSGCVASRFRIQSLSFDGLRWSNIVPASTQGANSHRPTLAAGKGGEVWAFWDTYDGRSSSVKGRQILPAATPIEQVSPAGHYCLKPTALATDRGLFVAWLRKQDVRGGSGVISQWHTLHAAVRQPTSWVQILDQRGDAAAAELTHGLMAQIEPRPVATGGYLGRRTAPMLLDDGSSTWLLWERKADHRGSTATVTGDLVARQIRDGKWQTPRIVCQNRVDYHLAYPPTAAKGRFDCVASDVPRSARRVLFRVQGSLYGSTKFAQERWEGWQPVELPVTAELTQRREIRKAGQSLMLFWADLHGHCNLSADAEGEPDELNYYARDRAVLDVVVFSDNDYYLVPMTQHEYELGNFYARTHSTPRQFLSLQGYEWTSRIPGMNTAKLADPGNWTPPYRHGSTPNHRTVIYPDAGGPILRFPEIGNDIKRLNAAVKVAGGITLSQHQVFQPTGHPVEAAMEVTAGWGRYIQSHPQTFFRPLQRGAKLGFVANGDSHRRAPGLSGALTGIYAPELTTEAILDAIRQRRCYATNGSRIFLDTRLNGSLMGEHVMVDDGKISLSLHTIGTRPIGAAVLFRDGVQVKKFAADQQLELRVTYEDPDVSGGEHWYFGASNNNKRLRRYPAI